MIRVYTTCLKIAFGRCPNGRWIYTNGEISGKPEYLWPSMSLLCPDIGDVCGLIRRDRCHGEWWTIYRELRITLSIAGAPDRRSPSKSRGAVYRLRLPGRSVKYTGNYFFRHCAFPARLDACDNLFSKVQSAFPSRCTDSWIWRSAFRYITR